MNILIVSGEGDFPRLCVGQDASQPLDNGVGVLPGDDSPVRQHGGMGHGTGDILLVQPLVKGDRCVQFIYKGVGVLAEAPRPEFHRARSFHPRDGTKMLPRPAPVFSIVMLKRSRHFLIMFCRTYAC